MSEEYNWKMVNMVGDTRTKKVIKNITDKANWDRKRALDDEFWSIDLRGKI